MARIAEIRLRCVEELDRHAGHAFAERDAEGVPYSWREIDQPIVAGLLVSSPTFAEVNDPDQHRSTRSLRRHERAIASAPAMLSLSAECWTRCAVEVDSLSRVPRRLTVAVGVIVRRDAVDRREERSYSGDRIDRWTKRER
jgi:hypothetical protein